MLNTKENFSDFELMIGSIIGFKADFNHDFNDKTKSNIERLRVNR